MTRIVVVDDDAGLRDLLCGLLAGAGYAVDPAADGDALDRALAEQPADLVLLDVMLPGRDGLALCRALKDAGGPPVILVTARGEQADLLEGLDVGATDYITKPFSSAELLARVRAVLRRSDAARTHGGDRCFVFGRWVIDEARRELRTAEGVLVALTTTEFNLLAALVRAEGQPLSRERLLREARGRTAGLDDRTVDVHVARLRRKLGREDAIVTVPGIGYAAARFSCGDLP